MPTTPDFLTTFLTRILEKVPGVSTDDLTAAQVTANLQQAIREYSRNVPLVVTVNINGDGNYEYTIPTGWVPGFSAIQQIEYPAGIAQTPSDNIIAPEKYGVYNNATVDRLRFFDTAPGSGNIARVTFTTVHSVVTAASTIFSNDFDSVCSLAAAFCCFDLARRYGQDNDSFISADSVDRRSKSDKFLSLGKSLVNEFSIHFGLNKDVEIVAASGTKNLDMYYPGGIDFLTHHAVDR